jgi:NAD dependent epimerase/dehydratase family enzyme
VMGGGGQVMSWISLPDLLAAIVHVLERPGLVGPVNGVSPNPVTNCEFTRALARAVGRPAVLPVPAVALKLALGEMARETILASQHVVPAKLLASGFEFRHPTIDDALRDLLGRR